MNLNITNLITNTTNQTTSFNQTDNETVVEATVTRDDGKIGDDGKIARVWLGLKFNNKGQVVATLTTKNKNYKETTRKVTAHWR